MAGHHERREQLRGRFRADSINGFDPQEILELLLSYSIPRSDPAVPARDLMDRFGSVAQVLSADPVDLERVPGVTSYSATLLSLIAHVAEYYQMEQYRDKPVINDVCSMGKFCTALLMNSAREQLHIVGLDGHGRLAGHLLICTGTLNEMEPFMRDIVNAALQLNSSGVVLTHNHPGMSVRPSPADISTTRAAQAVLQRLDIELLDHIVVGGGRYHSMTASGMLYGDLSHDKLSPALRAYTRYLDDENPPDAGDIRRPSARRGKAGSKPAAGAKAYDEPDGKATGMSKPAASPRNK